MWKHTLKDWKKYPLELVQTLWIGYQEMFSVEDNILVHDISMDHKILILTHIILFFKL
jgi:hypothetical protein